MNRATSCFATRASSGSKASGRSALARPTAPTVAWRHKNRVPVLETGPNRRTHSDSDDRPPLHRAGPWGYAPDPFLKNKKIAENISRPFYRQILISNCEENNYCVCSYNLTDGFYRGKSDSRYQHTTHCKLYS